MFVNPINNYNINNNVYTSQEVTKSASKSAQKNSNSEDVSKIVKNKLISEQNAISNYPTRFKVSIESPAPSIPSRASKILLKEKPKFDPQQHRNSKRKLEYPDNNNNNNNISEFSRSVNNDPVSPKKQRKDR